MLMMLVMRTLWALADVDLSLTGAADAREARFLGPAGIDLGLERAADDHDAREAHSLDPAGIDLGLDRAADAHHARDAHSLGPS